MAVDDELDALSTRAIDVFGLDAFAKATERAAQAAFLQGERQGELPQASVFNEVLKLELRQLLQAH